MTPAWLKTCGRGLLTTASGIYWFGHEARRLCFQSGLVRSHRFHGVKVISVGNLTWGGTGKTPLVIWLIQRLKAQGRKVAVLMRGYGGDEPLLIKAHVEHVPIFAGPDRVRNAKTGLRLVPIDAFILDDGFQHYQIARDLDIVTIDATKPLGNGHLIPRGNLRDAPSSLKRAGLVVLTKTNLVNVVQLSFVESLLRTFQPTLPIVHAIHEPIELIDPINQESLELETVRGRRVMAVSAIGDPEGFERLLKHLGAELVQTMRFRDHHRYRMREISKIIGEAQRVEAEWIITTEKDWIRLEQKGTGPFRGPVPETRPVPLLFLRIRLKVTQGEELLQERLAKIFEEHKSASAQVHKGTSLNG